MPGGDHAVAVHKGPYARLAAFYAHLCGEWIPTMRSVIGTGMGAGL